MLSLCLANETGYVGVGEREGMRNWSHTEKGFVCQSTQFGLYFENTGYRESFFCMYM